MYTLGVAAYCMLVVIQLNKFRLELLFGVLFGPMKCKYLIRYKYGDSVGNFKKFKIRYGQHILNKN
jgi:hypothetical protein